MTTSCLTAMFVVVFAPPVALSNPMDGVVTVGNATISADGSKLNINQSSDKAVIDWRGFDIAPHEITQFYQPGSGSVTLNRVNSGSASQIDGTLIANGNIFILNQNGVMFGQGSKVDVNGLVVSTADMRNADFMAGNFALTIPGNPNASIVNNGTITAKQAGLVGLVAPQVTNNGIITAQMGRVHLASGDTATVDLYGDGLLEVAVSDHVTSQLVSNNGILAANGGTVALTAAAGRQVVNSIVNVSGDVSAMSVGQKNGKIIIGAANQAGSSVTVSGKLHAKGTDAGTKGGDVTILGDEISLLAGTDIDVSGANGGGTVLVGGDLHGLGTAYNARNTTLASGAKITADATDKGNGGKVILWGDQRTVFAGDISARGGVNGGNGGFAETSGKQHLKATGNVDLRGDNAGTWLLDPTDIIIRKHGYVGNNVDVLSLDYLEAQSVNANISVVADNDLTLHFEGETLNITTAGRTVDLVGNMRILTTSAGAITTNNGNISLSGVNMGIFINHDFAFNSGTAMTTLTSINSPITFANNLTLGGNTTLNAYGNGVLTFGGTVNGNYDLKIEAGTVTSNGAWGGSAALGNVTVQSLNDITLPAITTLAGKSVNVTAIGTNSNIQTGGVINVGMGGNIGFTSDNVQIDHDLIGTGTITLQPYNDRNVRINFYDGSYDLSTTELDHLVDGWNLINIGRSGQSYIAFGGYTWKDSVYLRGSSIDTYGAVNGINEASIRFESPVTISQNVSTQNGAITFDGIAFVHDNNNAIITSNGGAITFNNGIVFNQHAAGTLTVNSNGGAINVSNAIEQRNSATAGRYLTLNAGSGVLNLGNTTINGGNIFNFTASSIISNQASWGNLAPLRGLTINSVDSIVLPALSFLSGANLNVTVSGLNNSITTSNAIDVGTGGNIAFQSDDVHINYDLSGTGQLTLQPYSDRTMRINFYGGEYDLTLDELDRIVDGWSLINLGKIDAGYAALGEYTWKDSVYFRSHDLNQFGHIYTSGAATSLRFNGNVAINYDIATQGGSVTFDHLALVSEYAHGQISTQNGAVNFNGGIRFDQYYNATTPGMLTVNSGNGPITVKNFIEQLGPAAPSAVRALTLIAGNGVLDLSTATLNGGNSFNFNAGTILTGGAAFGDQAALGNLTITTANSLALPALNFIAGSTLDVTVTGAGNSISTGGAIAVGAGGNIIFTSDDVTIGHDLSGTGTLTLRPYSTARIMRLNASTGDYNLSQAEIDHMLDGWNQIRIGRADNQAALYFGTLSFKDSVYFLNNDTIYQTAGSTLTGLNTASFGFGGNGGWFAMNGNIITNGGSVGGNHGFRILGPSTITTNGGIVNLASIDMADNLTVTTNDGNIYTGTVTEYGSSAGKTLTLDSRNGTTMLIGMVDIAADVILKGQYISQNDVWGSLVPLGNLTINGIASTSLLNIRTAAGKFVDVVLSGVDSGLSTRAIDVGANGNISLTADDVAFGGYLTGTGTLTLQPYHDRRIRINFFSGDFNLSSADLSWIRNGWGMINIGRTDTSHIQMGAVNFFDPVTFRAPFLLATGSLAGHDDASFTFLKGGTLESDVFSPYGTITVNGTLTINADVAITTWGGAIALDEISIANNMGSLMVRSNNGTISVARQIVQHGASAAGRTVTLDAGGAGTINIGDVIDGAFDLTLISNIINTNTAKAWGHVIGLGNVTINGFNSLTLPSIFTDSSAARNITVSLLGWDRVLTTTGELRTSLGGNISLTSDDLILGGALTGTGTLTLQPMRDKAMRVDFYGGDYNLDQTEIDRITDGWSLINIGRTDVGYIQMGSVVWRDPVAFRAPTLMYDTNSLGLRGINNSSFSFLKDAIFSSKLVTTNGGNISLSGDMVVPGTGTWDTMTIATNGGNVAIGGSIIRSSNSSNNLSILTNGGNITVGNQMRADSNAPGSRDTLFDAGTGNITLGGTVSGPYFLTLRAQNISFNGALFDLLGADITSTNSLILPSITASGIHIRTTAANADITLSSGSFLRSYSSGNSLVVAAGRNFINNAGTTPLDAGNGRWLIFSANPTDTIGEENIAADFNRYSCAYAAGGVCAYNTTLGTTITLPGTGNGIVYSYTPILTATPGATNVTYGDAANLNGYGYVLSGYLGNDATLDSITGSLDGSSGYAQGNDAGGVYGIHYGSGVLSSNLGYGFTYANNNTALTVLKRTITAALNGGVTKVYDGTNSALFSAGDYVYTNVYNNDDVYASNLSGTYDDANVGTGKNVTLSGLTLAGSKASNYELGSTTITTTADITKRDLTIVTDNKTLTTGQTMPTFTGSNDLVAADAGLVSWDYAPIGYTPGQNGDFTIGATATDPSSRLGNYTIINQYGVFSVSNNVPAPTLPPIPDTVLRNPQTVMQTMISFWDSSGAEEQIDAIFSEKQELYSEGDSDEPRYISLRNRQRQRVGENIPLVSATPEFLHAMGLRTLSL